MVLRRYFRGGLMAKLSRESYLFTSFESGRAAAELKMLNEMIQKDLPVPKPVAALVVKTSLLTCQNAILVERISGAEDGYQCLLEQAWSSEIWAKLGQMIKQFHNEGVYHSDMNIHNILIDTNNKFWLIDFDKCRFRAPNSSWQDETIARLKRSLLKEQSKHPDFHFTEADWQAFLSGYQL